QTFRLRVHREGPGVRLVGLSSAQVGADQLHDALAGRLVQDHRATAVRGPAGRVSSQAHAPTPTVRKPRLARVAASTITSRLCKSSRASRRALTRRSTSQPWSTQKPAWTVSAV